MVHRFVRKLRHAGPLNEDDEAVLTRLGQPVRRADARSDLVTEGAETRFLLLIVEGWACRYRLLENGRRQILSLVIPGDLCEPFGVLPRSVGHSLGAITPVVLTPVSLDGIRNAAQTSPRINEALWWDLLMVWSIEREQVVSLGRRSASERMAHLFCELHLRLNMIGLGNEADYEMPLTQADLGDVLGLSTVHVNRSLQDLRRAGLISLRGGRLTIHDLQGLRDLSFFDAAYLNPKVSSSL